MTLDEKGEAVCRCAYAYLGAQAASEPVRCEQCGGLVDEVADERLKAVYAESRARLEAYGREAGLDRKAQ